MYKFYATLLDSYQYFLHSESETAMQEFIDKINRVQFDSEAADKGTAFNELVDLVLNRPDQQEELLSDTLRSINFLFKSRLGTVYNFDFKSSIISEFVKRLNGYASQIRTEAVIQTSKGPVLLYGVIDEILGNDVTDIKTTSRYEFPKYLHNWQHKVYPYCLNENGIFVDQFTYRVTDFNNYYEECYPYNPEKSKYELVGICEGLIDFIEMHRTEITDLKVFGEEESA